MSKQLSFYNDITARDIEAAQTTLDEESLSYNLLNLENWIRIHCADEELVAKLEEYGAFHNAQCLRLAKMSQTEKSLSHIRSMLFDCATYNMTVKMLDALHNSIRATNEREVSDMRAALFGTMKHV